MSGALDPSVARGIIDRAKALFPALFAVHGPDCRCGGDGKIRCGDPECYQCGMDCCCANAVPCPGGARE